jgi:hypothetical protein
MKAKIFDEIRQKIGEDHIRAIYLRRFSEEDREKMGLHRHGLSKTRVL